MDITETQAALIIEAMGFCGDQGQLDCKIAILDLLEAIASQYIEVFKKHRWVFQMVADQHWRFCYPINWADSLADTRPADWWQMGQKLPGLDLHPKVS